MSAEADALATRGLLSINPSGSGYEAFADSLATRGYIFLVHAVVETITVADYFRTTGRPTFNTPGRPTFMITGKL